MISRSLILGFLIMTFSGCYSPGYLLSLGYGQGKVLWKRVPVEKVLTQDSLKPEIRDNIQLVLEAKHYGEEKLGLRKTDSYRFFLRVPNQEILYTLVACPKDKLEPKKWYFPVIGSFPYLGFFNQQKALRAQESLDKQGYDTYLQGAIAYSTLGWFSDPIFSSILQYPPEALINIILHELVHATIFAKGYVEFNESLATFLAGQGTIDFLKDREGPSSSRYQKSLAIQHDELVFSQLLTEIYQELKGLYSSLMPRERILERRKTLFAQAIKKYSELKSQFRTKQFDYFGQYMPLNNAWIVAYWTYYQNQNLYYQIYQSLGKDTKKTVAFFQSLASSREDPTKKAKQWLLSQRVNK